jgi:uncharacterized protein YeaO (DUF488 family)
MAIRVSKIVNPQGLGGTLAWFISRLIKPSGLTLSTASINMKTTIKRVYEPAAKTDGTRILIDRLWPRGLTKQVAKVDVWLKDIAPGTELRKWFAHDPKKMESFSKKYIAELEENPDAVTELKQYIKKRKVTLVYGAKDPECNHAVVLQSFLK